MGGGEVKQETGKDKGKSKDDSDKDEYSYSYSSGEEDLLPASSGLALNGSGL